MKLLYSFDLKLKYLSVCEKNTKFKPNHNEKFKVVLSLKNLWITSSYVNVKWIGI